MKRILLNLISVASLAHASESLSEYVTSQRSVVCHISQKEEALIAEMHSGKFYISTLSGYKKKAESTRLALSCIENEYQTALSLLMQLSFLEKDPYELKEGAAAFLRAGNLKAYKQAVYLCDAPYQRDVVRWAFGCVVYAQDFPTLAWMLNESEGTVFKPDIKWVRSELKHQVRLSDEGDLADHLHLFTILRDYLLAQGEDVCHFQLKVGSTKENNLVYVGANKVDECKDTPPLNVDEQLMASQPPLATLKEVYRFLSEQEEACFMDCQGKLWQVVNYKALLASTRGVSLKYWQNDVLVPFRKSYGEDEGCYAINNCGVNFHYHLSVKKKHEGEKSCELILSPLSNESAVEIIKERASLGWFPNIY